MTAWEATPKVDPPRPQTDTAPITLEFSSGATEDHTVDRSPPRADRTVDEIRVVKVRRNGSVYARTVFFQTAHRMAGQTAYVIEEIDRVLIFDDRGTLITDKP